MRLKKEVQMNNDITIDPEEIRKLPTGSIIDVETIRQIALWSIKFNDNTLNSKIKKEFAYVGLYPHVITSFGIMPEHLKNDIELQQRPKEGFDYEARPQYIPGSCIGVKCFCGKDAKHKVGEVVFDDDPCPMRHELTSYICCEHFQMIFGSFAKLQCLTNKHNG